MQPFTLIVGNRERTVNYNGIKPYYIAKLHYQYIMHMKKMHKKTDTSLYTEFIMMHYVFIFLDERKMEHFDNFSYANILQFYTYLATTQTKNDKLLSQSSQRLIYTFFKSFAKWLNEYHPQDAPPLYIFIKSKFKRNNETLKTSIISDYALQQIKRALSMEEDVYARTYITVLIYYGLRSCDIISLKTDCLRKSDKDGKYDLYYVDHKAKEQTILPAIEMPVFRAINALMEYTFSLRKRSAHKEIFIKEDRHQKIKILLPDQSSMLKRFVKKHNIRTENGAPLHLTAHMFRRTLATNLQSSGTSIEATQMILNHKHKRTTMQYYIKTKETEYITKITQLLEHMQIISNTENIPELDNSSRLKHPLRLADGYCLDGAMAKDDNYICDTFKKRANCYGCSKMVTTPDFLPYFRQLYKEKVEELKQTDIYRNHMLQHIEFEKELIKTIIKKLEQFEVEI